jgi:hypothetical protein
MKSGYSIVTDQITKLSKVFSLGLLSIPVPYFKSFFIVSGLRKKSISRFMLTGQELSYLLTQVIFMHFGFSSLRITENNP